MEPETGDVKVEGWTPTKIVNTINGNTVDRKQCLFFRDEEEKLWIRVVLPPTAADRRVTEKQETE